MAKTYGNPHTRAPKQCSGNIPTWTDSTITANSTKPRKIHIDELRTAITNEFTRRGLSIAAFTNPTITDNSNSIRKTHLDELRARYITGQEGDCSAEAYYCPQDTSNTDAWTDTTITANSTKVRKPHVDELRTKISSLMTSCICEAEYCNYCADCGYSVRTCDNWDPCCHENQPGQCPKDSWSWKYYCGSINTASGTTNPYKSWDGGTIVAFDGTLPWAMCNYIPPGSNWGSCEYNGGHDHSAWDCKCNPYTWT